MSREWDGTLPEVLTPCEDDEEQLRRFIAFLDGCRGDEAIGAASATDFRERALCAAREEMFHRIGLVVREYVEVLKVTGDGTVEFPESTESDDD